MPYGYYQGVRFAGLLGFALLAYRCYEQKKVQVMIVFIGLAVLFQPFVKIALGRTGWNVIDVVVAVGLIGSVFWERRNG